ncbi:MAG: hypothetical protein FWG92_02120 [Leptospirales bacterium]|nr:hypothetical protein [Leptospirales bacterium]
MNRNLPDIFKRFILCFAVLLPALLYAAPEYILKDGVILEVRTDSLRRLSVGGSVIALDETEDFLFYLKKTSNSYHAGRIPKNGDDFSEIPIAINVNAEPKKFFASGRDAVVLAVDGGKIDGKLFHVYFDEGGVRTADNIIDVAPAAGSLILLEGGGGGVVLNFDGSIVPCGINARRISNVISAQIVVVTDGNVSEIIDIQRGKDIYAFSRGVNFAFPENYNLVFEATDTMQSSTADNRIIFYKVFINGVEAGRTETGIAPVSKIFTANLDSGKYHVISPERWELDRKKEEYVRVNNVHQPKPVRIYVPENRIVKLLFFFDGKEYKFSSVFVIAP